MLPSRKDSRDNLGDRRFWRNACFLTWGVLECGLLLLYYWNLLQSSLPSQMSSSQTHLSLLSGAYVVLCAVMALGKGTGTIVTSGPIAREVGVFLEA